MAAREQCRASVLLLPLRKEPEYKAVLPGKLFEYLAARKPILGIGQPDGAMATIVSDASAGKTFGWEDRDSMKYEIDSLWQCFLEGSSAYEGKDISVYSRKLLSAKMAELMNNLSDDE